MFSKVDQRKAQADGDMVAGNKVTYNQSAYRPKSVEALLEKLKDQIDNNQHAQDTITELARYHVRRSADGIDGLENKLEAAKLSHIYLDAIDKKERFAKLLETMSLYSSAQSIFAIFLAQVENEFMYVVYPEIPNKSESEINTMIIERIVKPICAESDCEVMHVDYDTVFGMVYWLAEQCFIRWHK